MHELSIAMSLLEVAEDRARQEGAERISKVFLRIGPLSGVVPDALTFAFDVASRETLAEGASLEIEVVPITVYCSSCGKEMQVDSVYSLVCPSCGRPAYDIRSGNELEITSMEIE